MTLFAIFLLFVVGVAFLPAWRPYENRAVYGGYYPSGGLLLLFLVLVILVLTGHLRV